jgi:hypothetical protein
MQSDDVLVSLGYALEHGDFVADLWGARQGVISAIVIDEID